METGRPLGISIISSLFMIGGILGIVAGTLLLEEIVEYPNDYPASDLLTGSDAENNFIIMILGGMLLMLLAIGLFSGRIWAYKVVLFIILLVAISRITYLTWQTLDQNFDLEIDGIFYWQIATLALNLLIFWYLLARRHYFTKYVPPHDFPETVWEGLFFEK